ncbi:pyridoxamine 5'-phosphate oxidase family protein [Frankia nepalensis]|uniref:pyridoxamine 5'-phosphate oxidase family protein n=1 Tax=Frankia nepalensis TaxID=1836974 RepID=UPI00193199CC|nr:pyridoxamine 5'-phosphate oxidase family protein [Frankia nepalensis]MBL7499426.1 pyridoxamine 5'-phosphate oxidase family protein [Frankia nepalensis]MBL7516473.1 pyridoxamine 5'-phosphate oxidase family protein [Frankia nepalensis]
MSLEGATSQQRRGKRIAMSPEEVDAFLLDARTCRVSTVGADGAPHTSALWFVWDGTALWLNSVGRSQRWTDLARDPRVSVLIDAGHDFGELHGVELTGRVEVVGEVPRTGDPAAADLLTTPEKLFGDKYANGKFFYDGGHAWLKLVPERVVSWDFRKMRRG